MKASKAFIASVSFCSLIVLSLLVLPASRAAAATAAPGSSTGAAAAAPGNSSGQALEIAPPVINLTAKPGQTITTQISLRDISSTNLIVTSQVNDFLAAGEDGTPKILLDDTSENPYSLKNWIAPIAQLNLIPRQIKNLPVTINVPANASPGGHYGVVRFTGRPPELSGTGVSLSASLGSLLLITVDGPVKEKMSVASLTVSKTGSKATKLFESTPLNFTERLKNEGTTHEQPVGQVVIYDMFGKKAAAVNVNLPPRNVLPASVRKFDQPLDSSVIGNKKFFGRYRADLSVTYGGSKQVATASTVFWVIPYKLVTAIVVGLVGGFFALRFAIKRYNQSIISRSQNTRRRR